MARIRRAVLADAEAMAAVHVASWESTYAGVLPAAYIAERTLAVRYAFWRDRLIEADPAVCIFVACGDDGEVCGFASGGNGALYSKRPKEWGWAASWWRRSSKRSAAGG